MAILYFFVLWFQDSTQKISSHFEQKWRRDGDFSEFWFYFGKIKKMFHGENLNFPSRLETKLVNSNSQMFKFPWNVSLPSSPLGKLGYSWGKLEKSGLNFIASELNTCAVLSSNSLLILKKLPFFTCNQEIYSYFR